MKVPLLAVCLLFLARPLAAADATRVAGVDLPDRVAVGGQTLRLVGAGVHEVSLFNVDVYVAGLYLARPSSSPREILESGQTKRLALRFKRDVKRKELLRAAEKELRRQLGGRTLAAKLDTLRRSLPDLRKGDELSLTFCGRGWLEIAVNGRRRGQLKGAGVAKALLAIWIGPRPVSKSLKKRLLGRR